MSEQKVENNPEQATAFIVQKDVLQATLNYLATKPYKEVSQLVALLRSPKPYFPENKKEDPKVKRKRVVRKRNQESVKQDDKETETTEE